MKNKRRRLKPTTNIILNKPKKDLSKQSGKQTDKETFIRKLNTE